jgi:hypothetical protein
MADGDRADFDLLYDPRAADQENGVQPPSSRVPGPAGFYSTALWFTGRVREPALRIQHSITDGSLVAVNSR